MPAEGLSLAGHTNDGATLHAMEKLVKPVTTDQSPQFGIRRPDVGVLFLSKGARTGFSEAVRPGLVAEGQVDARSPSKLPHGQGCLHVTYLTQPS